MIIKSYEIEKKVNNFLKFNLFLLYGENYGLKKDIEKSIKSAVKINDKNTEFLSFYENEIIDDKENLYNTIYSGSLFSDKKIIVINNCSDKVFQTIEDITFRCPENIYLIIFAEILDKKSKLRNHFEKNKKTLCVPCYLDNEQNIRMIAINELKINHLILSNESINLLVEKSNNGRNNLKNEIEKIKSFALDKQKIEIEEIKSLINFSGEYKSDNLVNECLCGNVFQYKRILSEIYSNTINQIFLLRILANKIQRLVKIKEQENNYNNLENLLSASKPPIFWKEKPLVKKQLSIWNINSLKIITREINEVEFLCKKNPQVSKLIFFSFFTKICKKASNYS